MKKGILLCLVLLAFMASAAFAIDIPTGLIDSKPDKAVLVNLDEFYAQHPSTNKKTMLTETIFSSPRVLVTVRTGEKEFEVKPHFHATSDEIVIIIKGSGEMLINGKWVQVKAGDIHVNPRGVVHSTRAPKEDLKFISIFTPQLPPGGDANFVNVK
jgi:quercetin dioxygenase-like cupin family protein